MKISIAMATYNGAKYLPEQLDSFLAQEWQPDELVATDDDSTDETVEILENFRNTAPFEVVVYQNGTNLGYAQNFSRAMSLCSGDLVFLSDQDDIWFPEKIREIVRYANCQREKMLFMNDAELTDANARPLGLTKLGQNRSLGVGDVEFTTGCCMAVRRCLLEVALPVPHCHFVHDTWLNRLACLFREKLIIPTSLQYYRRHGDNASAWIASRTTRQSSVDLALAYRNEDTRFYAERRLAQLDQLEARISKSARSASVGTKITDSIDEIGRERDAVRARLKVLRKARWRRPSLAISLYLKGKYGYFSGWKSLVKDIFY